MNLFLNAEPRSPQKKVRLSQSKWNGSMCEEFYSWGVPQEAAFLLSLEACGTAGPESVNGWDMKGARVTFRSQEIQKINSHSLLQATSPSKDKSNWIWPFLVSLTSYAIMVRECCDMFALVADREKQFPKHEKTCRNSLRNWICMSSKELRV